MSTKLSTGHHKVTNTTFNVKMTSYASTLNWRQTTDRKEKKLWTDVSTLAFACRLKRPNNF